MDIIRIQESNSTKPSPSTLSVFVHKSCWICSAFPEFGLPRSALEDPSSEVGWGLSNVQKSPKTHCSAWQSIPIPIKMKQRSLGSFPTNFLNSLGNKNQKLSARSASTIGSNPTPGLAGRLWVPQAISIVLQSIPQRPVESLDKVWTTNPWFHFQIYQTSKNLIINSNSCESNLYWGCCKACFSSSSDPNGLFEDVSFPGSLIFSKMTSSQPMSMQRCPRLSFPTCQDRPASKPQGCQSYGLDFHSRQNKAKTCIVKAKGAKAGLNVHDIFVSC